MGFTEVSSSCSNEMYDPVYLRRFSQGSSLVSKRESSHLFCMMSIAGWLRRQCKGNWPHLNLIWGTPQYLAFPEVTSEFFLSCDSVVGDSLEFIHQVEAPYVFHWENAIALDTMQGNRASSRGEGKVSCVFSRCAWKLGYILELRRGSPFEPGVCLVKSGHLTRYEGQHRNVN